MNRAGSHRVWTPIPLADRVAIGTMMLLGLAVFVSAALGMAALAGWLLLDML